MEPSVVNTVSKVSVSVEKESFSEGSVSMMSFLQEEKKNNPINESSRKCSKRNGFEDLCRITMNVRIYDAKKCNFMESSSTQLGKLLLMNSI